MSVKTDIEGLIGTISDNNLVSLWATSGARFLIKLVPRERLEIYASALTDSGSGIDVTNSLVLRGHKSNIGARVIPPELASQSVNSSSIHYAQASDPIMYIQQGKAYIKPSGGTVIAVNLPSVTYSDTTIANFPPDLYYGVILYGAIQGRIYQLNSIITEINSLTINIPTIPTAPNSPAFIYTDANVGTISSTTISFTPTIDSFVSDILPTSVLFTPNINYNNVTFGGSYTNFDTAIGNDDIELATAHLNKVNTQLDEMQKKLLDALNEFNKTSEYDKNNLNQAISESQLTQQRLIQEKLNEFNKTLEYDRNNLQKAISEAQLTQQRLITAAQLQTDVNLKNEALKLEQQVSQYRSELELYANQINSYAQEIQSNIAVFNAELNEKTTKLGVYMNGLQALRNEFNEFIKGI